MLKSIQMNRKGIILLLISFMCVCIGQLMWKLFVEHGVFFCWRGSYFMEWGTGNACSI